MKKFLCLLLCFTLSLGLFCGCGTAKSTLQVGYGRADISPETSVPLRGYSNALERMSDSVTEPLYAACTAFTDDTGNTILLFHVDLCNSVGEVMTEIRRAISRKTDVPIGQIMVAATHTHSAPDYDNPKATGVTRYVDLLEERMIQAAQDAMADRKTAKMYTATAYPEDLNWIRYYNLSDGTYGSGGLTGGVTRVSHLRETDNQLQMIKFTREGGKDVVLVNWQGHPHRDGAADKLNVSADIVGSMRSFLEEKMDCQFAYFTGASGNVNNHSLLDGVTTTADYVEHGQALGQFVLDAEFTEVQTGKVQMVSQIYDISDKEDANIKHQAPMFAFSIGEVAFITAPYEMFDTSGQAIKEGSPYAMTFVATCANASLGYFPTEYAYSASQCYEVGVSKVAKGTAEIMEQEYIRMLKELHAMQ